MPRFWPFGRNKSVEKSVNDAAWSSAESGAATTEAISVKARAAQSKSLSPVEQFELSIAVRAAVSAIAENHSKCRFRVFTRTGREVNGGVLFDLLRLPGYKFSQRRLIWEASSWLNVMGEFMFAITPDANGVPRGLRPLAPQKCAIHLPATPVSSRAEVVQWRYTWPDGTQEYIRDDYLLYEKLWNPNPNTIRGLSPLVTGAVQVSGAYYAERYNKNFFENGAIPSHIIVVPEGTPKSQRDAFARQYAATYGNAYAGAHKFAVVAGNKDFKVEQLEQSFQDGAFMEMMKRGDLKVGQLYRVPAINMGIYDKTRFDTANEERKLFLEETLEPQAELIAEAFQFQLVDPFFQNSAYTTTGTDFKRQGKSIRKAFEKAEAERSGGLLILLDTDTLPIKHEVQLSKMDFVEKLRANLHMSPQEASDWMGLDIEPRKEREDVWIASTFVNITHPEQNAALVPGVKPGGEEAEKPAAKKPDPEKVKAANKFLRKCRKMTLDAIDAGGLWTLDEGYALAADDSLKPLVRVVRHGLRKIGDDKEDVKAYLGHFDPKPHLKPHA